MAHNKNLSIPRATLAIISDTVPNLKGQKARLEKSMKLNLNSVELQKVFLN